MLSIIVRGENKNVDEPHFFFPLLFKKSGSLAQTGLLLNFPFARRGHIYPPSLKGVGGTRRPPVYVRGGRLLLMQVQLKLHINIHS